MSITETTPEKHDTELEVLSGFGASLFRGLARIIIRGWLIILLLAIVATAGSLELARRLRLDTSVMALLPSDDPVIADVEEFSKLFRAGNELVALVERDDDVSEELVHEFMDAYAALLSESKVIQSVEYKLPTLTLEGENKRIEETFDVGYVYYTTTQKDAYLMFVSLIDSPNEIAAAKRLMRTITGIEFQARKGVEGNVTGISVKYTGGFAIKLEEWKAMEQIIRITSIASLGFALLLFALTFKRVTVAIYVGIALIMGILWTVAVAYLVIGALNLMTVAFAAILAGLGIDFGVHVSNRFLFERTAHKDPSQALTNTMVTTGKGVLFSCITTALAFYSLMLTDFDGASQFGFIVGTGIILCALSMLVVLPSLLLATAVIFKRRPTRDNSSGMRTLGIILEKQGSNVALLIILLIVGWQFFVFSSRNFPEFDSRLDNFTTQNNPALAVQKGIQQRFGNYFEPIGIVARSKNPDEAIRFLRESISGIEALIESGLLTRFECIFKYLPSAEKRKFIVKAMKKKGNHERALNYFLKRLKKVKSKQEEYKILSQEKEEILHLLRSDLSLETLDYDQLKQILPSVLFDKFFAHNDESGDHLSVCYIYPAHRVSSEEEIARLSTILKIDGKNLRMVGMSLMTGHLERLMQEQFKLITILIAAVLTVMLALICRRFHLVIISLTPLLLSLVVTITVMTVFDIRLNYMNIVAFPLILGIGIDNSIHMLYRYFEKGNRSIRTTISEAGTAIGLTSLTTIVGFGSLIFTGHNGLESLGILTTIGVGTCFMTTMLVLPGLLVIWDPPAPPVSHPHDDFEF